MNEGSTKELKNQCGCRDSKKLKCSNWDLYFLVGLGATCIVIALFILTRVTTL